MEIQLTCAVSLQTNSQTLFLVDIIEEWMLFQQYLQIFYGRYAVQLFEPIDIGIVLSNNVISV